MLSSSLIPGNEEAVYGVIDSLSKIGARVVTNAQARVHVSGHAYSGELLFLYNGVRPRNVMPVHGTWRMLRANAALAARTGVPPESIVLAENGVSVDLVAGKASIAGAVPVGKMFVDGLITGDVGDATLGERLILSSGFVAVTVVVHRGTGTPGRTAAPAFAGLLRRSQGAGTGRTQGRGRAGSSCRREYHGAHSDRPGGASHGRQVGGGDLPPPADDRADRHRDLVIGHYGGDAPHHVTTFQTVDGVGDFVEADPARVDGQVAVWRAQGDGSMWIWMSCAGPFHAEVAWRRSPRRAERSLRLALNAH